MTEAKEGVLLWEPSKEFKENANISHYMRWMEEHKGLSFEDYQELWEWSVADPEGFWSSIWEYFDVRASKPYSEVLGSRRMPGAEWFPGAKLNYAEHVFCNAKASNAKSDEPAIMHQSEIRDFGTVAWRELRDKVAALTAGLRSLGVERGDRVVAYVPSAPEALIAFLATASLGATWSSCSPDFGADSVVDRFEQIEPKVLIAVDGYRYGGKDFDRVDTVARFQREMPSLQNTVLFPYLNEEPDTSGLEDIVLWDELLSDNEGSSKCHSTTRCGCSTPPARPGYLRRSSTATAASCWNTSRSYPCTWT